ncbi:ATP-binding protein [Phenylobacterium sp.]|uniref:ATP-binding protein n=1 Tax=Phenylobacterium sp. TaxID=1871053 RepID=UPI002C422DDA|nr:ATP-binding protein [Phenylobacterium sp.]HVI31031.1 ATP-binding protein [Phenylobacterium sp.]
MRWPRSLQSRLGVGVALTVGLTWLVATLCAAVVIRHELDEAYDSALQETAQRLLPLAVLDITDRDAAAGARQVSRFARHEEFMSYVVRSPEGEVLLRSHDADPSVFPRTPQLGFHSTGTHRIYGEGAVSGRVVIEIAEQMAHRREAVLEAAVALLVPLGLLLPLTLAGAWWLVRASLRPLRAFRAEMEARGAGNLAPLPLDGLPRETLAIGTAANRLIERLRQALEAERSFTANSAHELRTPVAAALAQTQRLIAELRDEVALRRARQVENSLLELARLCEKLLQLSRAEGGGVLAETPQRFGPVLAHVAHDVRRMHPYAGGLRLSVPEAETHGSRMDPDAFGILARNLIENALRHGDGRRPVDVVLTPSGVLRVINSGPVVDENTLATVLRRFQRGGSAADGAGLGLAIAERIASGAGARLTVRSPAAGRDDGFEAVLDLAPTGPRSLAG